ncbi:MAG: hypothetical protein LC118_20975, partial [Dehalococcoidia bacterium]|nr:hypothetical protein [Dehalococcoidia bacterium]
HETGLYPFSMVPNSAGTSRSGHNWPVALPREPDVEQPVETAPSRIRVRRTWNEIMADVDRIHAQILARTRHLLDIDADIAELRGSRN